MCPEVFGCCASCVLDALRSQCRAVPTRHGRDLRDRRPTGQGRRQGRLQRCAGLGRRVARSRAGWACRRRRLSGRPDPAVMSRRGQPSVGSVPRVSVAAIASSTYAADSGRSRRSPATSDHYEGVAPIGVGRGQAQRSGNHRAARRRAVSCGSPSKGRSAAGPASACLRPDRSAAASQDGA